MISLIFAGNVSIIRRNVFGYVRVDDKKIICTLIYREYERNKTRIVGGAHSMCLA